MIRGRREEKLSTFQVEVVVENKQYVRDPEGETILKDLLVLNGYSSVKKVRTAKLLRMWVDADDQKKAVELVSKMCNDLRIYNPVVSTCAVSASE